jgi:hypothetical protein
MEKYQRLYNEIILESDKNVNKLHEFVKKRKEGADKIRKTAEDKGGASKLTAIHFAAKEKPYSHALDIATEEDYKKTLKSKGDELVSKLKQWHTMSQRDFQTVMGQLEAYGEVYIKCVKPNSVQID